MAVWRDDENKERNETLLPEPLEGGEDQRLLRASFRRILPKMQRSRGSLMFEAFEIA